MNKKPLFCFIAAIFLLAAWMPAQAMMEFPLVQSLAYFPFPTDPPPGKSNLSLFVQTYYSNIYAMAFEQEVYNDMELFSALLTVRYGIGERLFAEMYYRFFYVYGGFLDGIIEGFHNLFNLSLGGREAVPRNRVHYRYPDFFNYQEPTSGSSPLLLSIGYTLVKSPATHLVGRFFVAVPLVSKPGFVSDKPFVGAGLMLNTRLSDFDVHLSAYLASFRTPEWLDDEPLHPLIFFSRLELAYRRLKLGFILRTSPYRAGEPGHNGHQIYLGYRIAKWLEAGFVEDLPPFDTTLDMGIYLKFFIL